jgi:hypothetical protein
MKLTDSQRRQLRSAAIFGGDYVHNVVDSLQRENPDAFWRESELGQRRFYHEPIGAPHKSYVQHYKPGAFK